MAELARPGFWEKLASRLPDQRRRGLRSGHFWAIAGLMALMTLIYYGADTPLRGAWPFNTSLLSGVHDFHRTLFLIPVAYAALAFRMPGAIVSNAVFLAAVLPRALFISPNPDPLLRPLAFVLASFALAAMIASLLDLADRERALRRRLVESQQQLVQAEKMNALGQMAASIAHEVNNPLSGVLIYTRLLAKKLNAAVFSRQEAGGFLEKMESELLRASRLVQNLLDFSRQSAPYFTETDVNAVLEKTLELAETSAALSRVRVVKQLEPSLPLTRADAAMLQQVFTNLILNAVQAMPDGGTLMLRSYTEGDYLKVVVEDSGKGIPRDNLGKLFEPFFTTREKGVGLGLAVSYGIVQQHQGRIDVRSREGEGTTFTVVLPRAAEVRT